MQIIKTILLWGIILLPLTAPAQITDDSVVDSLHAEIESRMMEYADNLTQLATVCDMQILFSDATPLTSSYVQVLNEKIEKLNSNYHSIDIRWNTFTQAMQIEIADNEELMTLMAKVQQMKQTVADTIASKKQKCDALADFIKAEQLILSIDTTYHTLYKKAFKLSLLEKLGPQLEKIKAKEQTQFAQIQECYAKAQKANELVPVLSKRMEVIDDHYSNIQILSKKIQELEYKPLIQRIKDYLIGLACVAVLLLFINLAVSKYKAFKTARAQMKKYNEMMHKNGGSTDYPSI